MPDDVAEEVAEEVDADALGHGDGGELTTAHPSYADDYSDATSAGASLADHGLAASGDDQGGLVESVAFAPFGSAEQTAVGDLASYDGGFDNPTHTRLGHKPASARALLDDDPLAGGRDDDDASRG